MEYDIDFEALVRTKGTLVFLMGVTALEDICNSLLKAGIDKDMPAAILQKGTTAGQKRIVATVGTLKAEVDRLGIETPAIIVVGKVCSLADDFAWYEELPLAGYKVLLTRPRDLISSTAGKLRAKGAEVLELPAIRTVPIAENKELEAALENIRDYQWLVFTSPTGVKVFFSQMEKCGRDIRSLGTVQVAAIGEGTKKALKERGILADLMPEIYDGEALGHALAEKCGPESRILIPRAEIGNAELVKILEETGAKVEDVPTYRTCHETQDIIDEAAELEAGHIDCAVFTSASTVRGFVNAVGEMDYSHVKAACIGKQTRAEAEKYGMQTWMAEKATMDSLVELVIKMKADDKRSGQND